jgi:glycosyltransferase involved in cell wall biosynthesis
MHKILIAHDVEYRRRDGMVRWAYAQRSNALKRNAPDDLAIDRCAITWLQDQPEVMANYDLIFCIDYMWALTIRHLVDLHAPKAKLVLSYNRDHRTNNEFWEPALIAAHYVICNNPDRYYGEGVRPNTCVISNGVDTSLWRKVRPWKDRPLDVIWSSASSAGKKKGYLEIIIHLKPLMKAAGITCDIRPVMSAFDPVVQNEDEMVEWYNNGKVIICPSESEGGGPSMVLEALACGCSVVTNEIGSAGELQGLREMPNILMFDGNGNVKMFMNRIKKALVDQEMNDRGHKAIESWSYEHRSKWFYALFRALIEDRQPVNFDYRETHWSQV